MGIEPKTFRLQSECSTTKLKEHIREENKHIICLNLSTKIYQPIQPNIQTQPNFYTRLKQHKKIILANVLSDNKTHPGKLPNGTMLTYFIMKLFSYLHHFALKMATIIISHLRVTTWAF